MDRYDSDFQDRRLPAWWIGLAAAVAALLALASLPRVADHVGYAPPGRLPMRLTYTGRHYQQGSCWSGADPTRAGSWPLRPAGEVPALFGPSRPIMTGRVVAGFAPTIVFVPSGRGCYRAYGLEGGP